MTACERPTAGPAGPAYLSPRQIADRLGLSATDVVLDWIRSGKLPAIDVGGGGGRATYRVLAADCERFIEGRRVVPAQVSARRTRRQRPRGATQYF